MPTSNAKAAAIVPNNPPLHRIKVRILARQLAPRMIKGKPEPITAFAAYDVGGSNGRARGVQESAVIGRERELTALSENLEKARAGTGAVVVLEGDAGIGKTTIVNQTIAEATPA